MMGKRIFEKFKEDCFKFSELVDQQNLVDDFKQGIEKATTVDELYVAYDKFYEDTLEISKVVARIIPMAMFHKDEDTCQKIIQIMDSFNLDEELPKLIQLLMDKEDKLNNITEE